MTSLSWRLALGLFAALGAGACGPSVDPAAKADLDRHLAEVQPSTETFEPSDSFMPMPFAAGQWTKHTVRDGKGVQLLTYKLVGQDDGGYWLETLTESQYGREVSKMHVFMLGGRDPSGMEIRTLIVKKGNATPALLDVTSDPVARDHYRHVLDLLAVSFEGVEKDDARVPAGHFIGCWKNQYPGAWGPWESPSVVCAHPKVPLSGVVRAQPVSGGPVMELVAFGTNGAEGEL